MQPRELNPRRAAVAARLKAAAPAARPVRSGVDIDAVHYRLGAVNDSSEIGAGRLAGVDTCEGAPASACLAAIPQGSFNRDSSAGCRSSDTRARRPRRVVTGGQQLPPPKVAAPDDRPHGQPAGAGPGEAVR